MLIDMMQAPEHRLRDDPVRRVGRGRRSWSARRTLAESVMGTPRIEQVGNQTPIGSNREKSGIRGCAFYLLRPPCQR